MSAKSYQVHLDKARKSDAYWMEFPILQFTEELFVLMEQDRVSKAELARRMGTSPAYITKILKGDANFTLKSMVKLARQFNRQVRVHLAEEGTTSKWRDLPSALRSRRARVADAKRR